MVDFICGARVLSLGPYMCLWFSRWVEGEGGMDVGWCGWLSGVCRCIYPLLFAPGLIAISPESGGVLGL